MMNSTTLETIAGCVRRLEAARADLGTARKALDEVEAEARELVESLPESERAGALKLLGLRNPRKPREVPATKGAVALPVAAE